MITADDPFKGVNRLSRDAFVRILRERANPGVIAERDPGQYWDVIRAHDVDACLILAKFNHESSMGKAGVALQTHSWGNTRAPSFGATPIGSVPGRTGTFPVFRDWLDGCKSTVARLVTPAYVYSGESEHPETHQRFGPRTTIRELYDHPSTLVWAPAGDLNNPAGYLRAVLDFMNLYSDIEQEPTPMPAPRIALAAGHRNTSGGDAHETVQTGQLTPVIAATLRARGMDVRVITPDDGRGMFPGTLSAAARQVVTWAGQGWAASIYMEVHTEGNNGGDGARGAFAIYPDWGDDVDADVRDRLGPDIVRRLRDATGLPLRGNGVMSEKKTGVGAGGDRLGVFGATEPVRATTTRLIVEYGSHSSPADLAIWAQPGFLQRASDATADAFAAFLNWQHVTPAPQPEPAPIIDPATLPAVLDPWRDYAGGNPYGKDFWIPQPFVDWINAHGGFWGVGFVASGAFIAPDTGYLTQFFQGAALELHPHNVGTDYAVLRRHIGIDVLRREYPDHAPKQAA